MPIANHLDFLRYLPKSGAIQDAFEGGWGLRTPGSASPLAETADFGANPGNLTMYSYRPDGQTGPMPLVVVLHGCTQTAASYDVGAGWSTLADRYGFALLMPEQKRSNNPNTCFNWFDSTDIVREGGEAASIRQMIRRMAQDHPIDETKIFVTGLSAGGAMASVMLATYPDVFAAGAIIAGLPYGVATSVGDALGAMRRPIPRAAKALGDLVRQATDHKGSWPRVSVWHGSADRTVNAANASEIVTQWLDVHGLPAAPMAQTSIEGYPRKVWWGIDGETIVESYTITDMAHGTPLGVATGDQRLGAAGPFMIEAGISSSYYIAQFFGLTGRVGRSQGKPATIVPDTAPVRVRHDPDKVTFSSRPADDARSDTRQKRLIDINAVITRALTAAGLLK